MQSCKRWSQHARLLHFEFCDSLPNCLSRCSRKQRGALCLGISRQQSRPDIAESRIRQELSDLLLREPEPHVAHLLLILLPLVRQHIHDQHAPAGRSTRPDFRERARPGDGE